MANPSGRRGAEWETRCVEYLQENGFILAERRVKNGRFDRGDVSGVPGFTIEAKAERVIDLPGYLKELREEQAHAKTAFGSVWVKNRRHGIADGYAVRRIEDEVALMRLLNREGLL